MKRFYKKTISILVTHTNTKTGIEEDLYVNEDVQINIDTSEDGHRI